MSATPAAQTIPAGSRRERILEAAILEFAERGFEGATWRGVADRAGVAQGLIRFYFDDKEGLWRAAFRLATERRLHGMPPPAALPGQGAPDPVVVAEWARAFAVHVARHPQQARMVVREGAVGSERMAWAAEVSLREGQEAFLEGVEVLKSHGWFEGLAPAQVLYLLVGAAQYVFLIPGEVAALMGEDATSDAYIQRHADAVVRLFMAHAPSG